MLRPAAVAFLQIIAICAGIAIIGFAAVLLWFFGCWWCTRADENARSAQAATKTLAINQNLVKVYEQYIDSGRNILNLTKEQLDDVKDSYEELGNHFGAQAVDRLLARKQNEEAYERYTVEWNAKVEADRLEAQRRWKSMPFNGVPLGGLAEPLYVNPRVAPMPTPNEKIRGRFRRRARGRQKPKLSILTIEAMTEELSVAEQNELQQLEAIIEKGLETFLKLVAHC